MFMAVFAVFYTAQGPEAAALPSFPRLPLFSFLRPLLPLAKPHQAPAEPSNSRDGGRFSTGARRGMERKRTSFGSSTKRSKENHHTEAD